MKEIPVTQARGDLSNLVNEVVYNQERIVLTRHGKPLAVLVSVEDAKSLDASAEYSEHPIQVLDISGSQQTFGIAARRDESTGSTPAGYPY